MALACRVSTNLTPLLNINYCKCTINVKRFRLRNRSADKINKNKDAENGNEQKISFDEMIHFRREQARRSVLIQLHSVNCIHNCRDYCNSFGYIAKSFHFATKVQQQNFLLLEFQSMESVKRLINRTGYMKMSEYVSVPTTNLWYNNSSGFEENQSKRLSKDVVQIPKFAHGVPSLKALVDKLETITDTREQMLKLYTFWKSTDLDARLRFYTAHQLELCFSSLIPTLSVIPFGSSVNGFGQMGCDLDLVCIIRGDKILNKSSSRTMLFDMKPFCFNERQEQKEFLTVLSSIMESFNPGVGKVTKILEARVPILKFPYKHTNMQCDLSSTNTIALCMSELLYIYGQMDWRVKPLVCTVRKWAKYSKVTHETPGPWLTNFSLTLLIIFYLQQSRILPSVDSLKNKTKQNGQVDTFNYDIILSKTMRDSFKQLNAEPLPTLLYNFFKYYAEFNFANNAICIRDATIKHKRDSSALYIFNPFEPSLNVSRNVSWNEILRLKNILKNAMLVLESNPNNTVGALLGLEMTTKSPREITEKGSNEMKQSKSINESDLVNEDAIENSKQLKQIIK